MNNISTEASLSSDTSTQDESTEANLSSDTSTQDESTEANLSSDTSTQDESTEANLSSDTLTQDKSTEANLNPVNITQNDSTIIQQNNSLLSQFRNNLTIGMKSVNDYNRSNKKNLETHPILGLDTPKNRPEKITRELGRVNAQTATFLTASFTNYSPPIAAAKAEQYTANFLDLVKRPFDCCRKKKNLNKKQS